MLESFFSPLPKPLIPCTIENYNAARKDRLSSHKILDFLKSPWLYQQKHVLRVLPDADNDAFRLGRAAHTLILEGQEVFDRSYAIGGPVNEKTGTQYGRTTKAFATWAAEQGELGREYLTDDEAILCGKLREGVYRHRDAAGLLGLDGIPEATVRLDYDGFPMQIRIDWLARVDDQFWIVDLKTCRDLDRFEFDARDYGYIEQMAFYLSIFQVAAGGTGFLPVFIIAVEKSFPYRAGVWEIPEEDIVAASKKVFGAINELAACIKTDSWPTGYEEVRELKYHG